MILFPSINVISGAIATRNLLLLHRKRLSSGKEGCSFTNPAICLSSLEGGFLTFLWKVRNDICLGAALRGGPLTSILETPRADTRVHAYGIILDM